MNFSVLDFFKIASNCTDFSLDFQNFHGDGGEKMEGGGIPPDPPRNFLHFFSLAIPGCGCGLLVS